MVFFRASLAGLAVSVLVFLNPICVSLHAQDESPAPSKHEKAVPEPVEPGPFSAAAHGSDAVHKVDFRSADELSKQDQLLVANSESSIVEHAGFAGMEYEQNNWAYRQIVCPAFPNHLFLQYTRNNGSGDVSMFSASIPRNGEGRVRIVPILKHSYSLFSPAPINALTISAFNHIRAEEGEQANSDWLGNALCYAALAGAHPEIAGPDATPDPDRPIPAMTAQLNVQMQGSGEEVIRFADAAARPHPMEWSMTFTRKGKLVKATHKPADVLTAKPISEHSPVLRTREIPDGAQH
ncbi:MAG TPA: hypothetical protein VGF82_22795 [Terracidiphilus sp.]|jgi:hypothetical protein